MKQIVVHYTAEFAATIEVPDEPTDADIEAAVSNINIPEDATSKYRENTFTVDRDNTGVIRQYQDAG